MKKNLLLTFSLMFLFSFGMSKVAHAQAVSSTNLAKQYGSIHSDSGSEGAEPSSNLIDGITHTTNLSQKWCKASTQTHWVIIDLGQTREIASFKIYDCKVNEPGESNFHTYNIYVGDDVSNLTKVVEQSGRGNDNIKEDILASNTQGRYVKLEIPNFGTIRIWEFEIYDSAPNIAIDPIPSQKIVAGAPISVTASFSLRTPKAADFGCTVESKNDFVSVSNVVVDDATSTIAFDLTAPNVFGADSVALTIVNDGETLSKLFSVKSATDDLSDYINVAVNKKSTIWNYPQWAETAAPAILDGDDDSFFGLEKYLIEPIVDLQGKYLITALQYIYKCISVSDKANLTGASVYISPDVAAGTNDDAYVLQADRFPAANAGELKNEFVVLDKPMEAGTLKFKFMSDGWANKKLELYELKAFCEQPVFAQAEDQSIVVNTLKELTLDFDLKGFALRNTNDITFSVSSNNANIVATPIGSNFAENTFDLTINSATNKETGIITVTMQSDEFVVTQTINVTVKGGVSIEEQANDAMLEVYPTMLNKGERINVKAEGAKAVRLISLQGTIINEQPVTNGTTEISTDTLLAGTYLVQVSSDKSTFKTVKVIVK